MPVSRQTNILGRQLRRAERAEDRGARLAEKAATFTAAGTSPEESPRVGALRRLGRLENRQAAAEARARQLRTQAGNVQGQVLDDPSRGNARRLGLGLGLSRSQRGQLRNASRAGDLSSGLRFLTGNQQAQFRRLLGAEGARGGIARGLAGNQLGALTAEAEPVNPLLQPGNAFA